MESIEITAVVISLISLVVSIFSWTKSRVIYGVERATIRQYRGSHSDLDITDEHTNKMLSPGSYTILSTYVRPDGDIGLLFGRIKQQSFWTTLFRKPAQNTPK